MVARRFGGSEEVRFNVFLELGRNSLSTLFSDGVK